MKRLLCLLLMILCCLTAAGCSFPGSTGEAAVLFCYPRAEFRYGTPDGVILSEERDMPGHDKDLTYIISMYLMGPESDSLVLPFPVHTRLLALDCKKKALTVTLSDTQEPLADIQYTLACACLVKTCMEVCDAESFTILSGSRSLTLHRDSMVFFDSSLKTAES